MANYFIFSQIILFFHKQKKSLNSKENQGFCYSIVIYESFIFMIFVYDIEIFFLPISIRLQYQVYFTLSRVFKIFFTGISNSFTNKINHYILRIS